MADMTDTRITAEEYFQLPEYKEHDLIQLIDGEVIIGMPPVLKHQRIVMTITAILLKIAHKMGGEPFVAPTEVFLDENNTYQPDLLYLTRDTKCEEDGKRLIGAPELVVEVLSPSTAKHDRTTKYSAYEKHGVQEYWIVDPAYELIEVWTQGDSGFERAGAFAPDDEFESVVLAESIDVNAIFDVS
jgi:Uma2 family endonuclease